MADCHMIDKTPHGIVPCFFLGKLIVAKNPTPAAEQDKYILRLPDGMRDDLKENAAHNKRSLNAEIVARLEDYEAIKGDDIKWLKKEMERLRKERDEAEAKLNSRATPDLEAALQGGLPKGLYSRIASAAANIGRTATEEIVQALEATYKPFSLDQFNEEWIQPIIFASDGDRPKLLEQANEYLMQNGGIYEVWIRGPEDGKNAGAVVISRRMWREAKRLLDEGKQK